MGGKEAMPGKETMPSLHSLLTPPDLDPYPSPLTLCLQALFDEASQCRPTVVVPSPQNEEKP